MKKRVFISLFVTILFILAPFVLFHIEVEQVPTENDTINYSEYNEQTEDYDNKYNDYKEVNSEDYPRTYNNQNDYERYKEYHEQYKNGYYKSMYDDEIN
jgi:hypothetical protein